MQIFAQSSVVWELFCLPIINHHYLRGLIRIRFSKLIYVFCSVILIVLIKLKFLKMFFVREKGIDIICEFGLFMTVVFFQILVEST